VQKQAQPLTVELVRQISKSLPAFSELQNIRDRALLLIGFAGGFRRSELCALTVGDIDVRHNGLVLRLRSGKTDQYARGRDVAIPVGAHKAYCPVRTLQRWLHALAKALATDTLTPAQPLFARIDKHGRAHPGLSASSVGWVLKRRLEAHGLPHEGFSAHSLRAGLVTSAAKAGVPIWAIQRQTGHKSDLTVHRYIRNLGTFECNATASLL
jgi:integrase